jgi:hypothetical protein
MILFKASETMTEKTGKVYKISSPATPMVFIGSTVKSLEERFLEHQNDFAYVIWCRPKKAYCHSFDIFKCKNARIELLEEFPFISASDLRDRELYHISQTENCLNAPPSPKESSEIIICKCGKTYQDTREDKAKHLMTKEHIQRMEDHYYKSKTG